MAGVDDKSLILKTLADRQAGYFTAKQAIACGWPQNTHSYQWRHDHWLRVSKGLYRLLDYPSTPRSEWIRWLLWSRNNDEVIQGALCRDSALGYYGLLPDDSGLTHLAVPEEMRKRGAEGDVRIYPRQLPDADIVTDGLLRLIRPTLAVEESREALERRGLFDEKRQAAQAWEQTWEQAHGTAVDAAGMVGSKSSQELRRERRAAIRKETEEALRELGMSGKTKTPPSAHAYAQQRMPATSADGVKPGERLSPYVGEYVGAAGVAEAATAMDEVNGLAAAATRATAEPGWSGQAVCAGQGEKGIVMQRRTRKGAARGILGSPAGFTLVELLVVVAIISILASFLMPVLRSAQEAARLTGCLNHLRQQGMGVAQYLTEAKEKYPQQGVLTAANGWDATGTWFGAICPYIGWTKQIKPGTSQGDKTIGHCPNHYEQPTNFSYQGNSNFFKTSGLPQSATSVRMPSRKILVYEVHTTSQWPLCQVGYASGLGKTPFIPAYYYPTHKMGFNHLFADSHAAFSTEKKNNSSFWTP